MEKIIRSSTATGTSPTTKELHYLLRSLAPAACRDPETFTSVAKEILRVDMNLIGKRGEPEDDPRLLVKSLPGKPSVAAPSLKDVSKDVIKDLLDFLVQSEPEDPESESSNSDKFTLDKPDDLCELPATMASILSSASVGQNRPGPAVIRQISNDILGGEKKEETKESKENKEAEERKKRRHLLPKSAICRLLAEMVKSYAGCAKLITEHLYPSGMSELVKEDTTALAFILDELLTSSTDKECATLVKMLVAALASCNHAPEAQTSLVTEVKNALSRALSMTECSMKHTKVQALSGLISTMIEHCPTTVASNQAPFKSGQVNMNNIVKCLVKKNVITDLARVTHALDLSSPSMAVTVNAALKPLETLSRIVNQPSGPLPTKPTPKHKPEESRASEANNINTNTTNSEATRAQNEEIAGLDNEATEHDVSTAAESIDPNSESQLHTVEEADTEDFDEMMEQLLEGDRGESALLEVVVRNEGGQNMETDETINDSQMLGQEDSFVENEGGADDDSETDSSHSQESSAGEDDEELEENDEDDDGDEDDDDDDDDDGGSDVYDDEQDDLPQELEDAFFRVPGGDRDVDTVTMIGVNDDDRLLMDDRAIHSLPLWGDMALGDGVGSGDSLSGGGGAGSSSVAPSHPLLMGRSEQANQPNRGGTRTLQRQRGFRYIQLGRGSNNTGNNILQSLLSPRSSQDVLHIGNHSINMGLRESTRVLVMDSGSGFAILDSDELPFEGFGQSGGSALSNVPNALLRWNEESKVLDGDSLHDCMTICKPGILDIIDKYREEELADRREKKRRLAEEEEALRKLEEEERKKKEPEMATTPAPEAAGHTSSSADEMDVVVSENAAVHSAVDSIAGGGSISESAQRLAEDIANAISSRVAGGFPGSSSGVPPAISTAGTGGASQEPGQLLGPAGGLLSSLQDLLPGQTPPSSLSSVLQTLSSSYSGEQQAAVSASGVPPLMSTSSSSESVTTPSLPPTFQFSTPPPLFPGLPTPIPQASSALPDALGPLSPSPDQESPHTMETAAPAAPAASELAPPPPLPPSEPAAAVPGPGTSGTGTSREPDYSAILGDIEIPEGVDPSFLAALPEDMRQEVIEEQRRLVRARQQPPAQPAVAAAAAAGGAAPSQAVQEVNPEFLAALPPNIQEEVLQQQRMEQLRQRQANSDPTAAVDAGEFFQTLPPSLRQSLLAEMEESQISALPADMAAEAQHLRQDREMRSRQLMHERFFNHVNHSGPNLSSILRNTVNRLGSHYTNNLGGSGRNNLWRFGGRGALSHNQGVSSLTSANNHKFRGRHLLDHEGLSCLLILLFIDDTKLNTTRLHRILRNLCYHAPTRDWVVKCLLSILEKANMTLDQQPQPTPLDTPTPAKLRKSVGGKSESKESRGAGQTSWLNISMDAALGFRANVFQVSRGQQQAGKKSSTGGTATISVHPQAAPVVCRHTLDVLISLAKSFPIHFLPGSPPPSSDPASSGSDKKTSAASSRPLEFWETLLKLDRECWSSKKGKSVVRSHSSVSIKSEEEEATSQSLTVSAFGQVRKLRKNILRKTLIFFPPSCSVCWPARSSNATPS